MVEKETQGSYIIEIIRLGGSLKVTAVDPHTRREVSIVGSPKISKDELSQLAVRKLEYVLNKKNANQ